MIIKDKEYIRSILFGLEDSLISTTGLIAGISIGSNGGKVVLLAGTVAVPGRSAFSPAHARSRRRLPPAAVRAPSGRAAADRCRPVWRIGIRWDAPSAPFSPPAK